MSLLYINRTVTFSSTENHFATRVGTQLMMKQFKMRGFVDNCGQFAYFQNLKLNL